MSRVVTMQEAVNEAARKARRETAFWDRACHRHAERAAIAEKRDRGVAQ